MRVHRHPLQRFAALILAVLLLHTTWVSASAVCDAPHMGRGVPPAVSTHETHHAAHGSNTPVPDTPVPDTAPTSSPDGALPCPMAMTCTLTLAMSDVPRVTTVVRLATAPLPAFAPSTPRSWRLAPEPPPPRG